MPDLNPQMAEILALRQPRSPGGRPDRPAQFRDPLRQQGSTLRHQTGILVHVHPGDLPLSPASVPTDSLTGVPRMNNLHGKHS